MTAEDRSEVDTIVRPTGRVQVFGSFSFPEVVMSTFSQKSKANRWAGRGSLVALLLCGMGSVLPAQEKEPVLPLPKKAAPGTPEDEPPKNVLPKKPRPQPDTEIVPPVKHGLTLETTADGILVERVAAGSVGEEAKLEPGDLILRLAGKQVKTPLALDRRLHSYEAGTKLELAILRDAKERLLFLTLPADHEPAFLEKPSEAPKNVIIVQPPARPGKPVVVEPATEIGWTLQAKDGRVWIAEVTEGSAAALAGFRKGDQLVSIDKTPLNTVETVQRSLAGYEVGAVVPVQIDRAARFLPMRLTIPAGRVGVVGKTVVPAVAGHDAALEELLRRQQVQEELLTKVLAELQAISAELKVRRPAP